MSYKFTKGSQVIGDLKAADDAERNTLIDFGEDQIEFQTSGSVRLSIGNEGAVVAGDLEVSNEILASVLKNDDGDITIQASPNSSDVYIRSSDRVYIELDSDSNSTSYLQIRSNTSTKFLFSENGKMRIGDSTIPTNVLQIVHDGVDGSDGILLTRNDTSTTSGDLLGAIGFDSKDGNTPSSNLEASAFIAGYAAENHGTLDKGGYLVFGGSAINDNDDTISHEVMRITGNGKVGIGTTSPTSTFHTNGSVSRAIVTKTANYTATENDSTILIDASSSSVTITLPAVSGTTGRIYTIKCIAKGGGQAANIATNSSEQIDGSSNSVVLNVDQSLTIQSSGSAWYKIAEFMGAPPP